MKLMPTRIILLLTIFLLMHVDTLTLSGMLTKSSYVSVVKREYEELFATRKWGVVVNDSVPEGNKD